MRRMLQLLRLFWISIASYDNSAFSRIFTPRMRNECRKYRIMYRECRIKYRKCRIECRSAEYSDHCSGKCFSNMLREVVKKIVHIRWCVACFSCFVPSAACRSRATIAPHFRDFLLAACEMNVGNIELRVASVGSKYRECRIEYVSREIVQVPSVCREWALLASSASIMAGNLCIFKPLLSQSLIIKRGPGQIKRLCYDDFIVFSPAGS